MPSMPLVPGSPSLPGTLTVWVSTQHGVQEVVAGMILILVFLWPRWHLYQFSVAHTKTKYGVQFREDWDDLEIEFHMIRKGGRWRSERSGEERGKGLYFHYKAAMSLMWPEDDWHRWAE